MTILGEDVKSVNEFLYCKLSLCAATLMLAACGGGGGERGVFGEWRDVEVPREQ